MIFLENLSSSKITRFQRVSYISIEFIRWDYRITLLLDNPLTMR